jgi:HSP20 family protein
VRSFGVRSRIHAVVLPSEGAEFSSFADEVRRIFMELGRSYGAESLAGECSPPLDVYETDDAIHVAVDLPGVAPAAVRVLAKGNALLIAGEKAPRRGGGDSSFHLVERGFGRFARAVRLAATCDTSRATAVIERGELRVVVPKVPERRGRAMLVPVRDAGHGSGPS